ncbi:hypothetical protein CEUSTIGMA_g10053.t1 [Chlamydomonas eustigma]|uniref:Uncharacterized protein n=1 Tax=Chlamydomonas eustigma TaxID=1157962 RepID=A0A250XHR6_9CHLO|nr:hypothetical protein CEUSTIGMA_g10053.t1 [Chlamydomonas eustigma]|eukprot:GAX82627.1 hypothetical protein CEUSTIGMA_g10053.t1 [Chlamydomonas eustigma]
MLRTKSSPTVKKSDRVPSFQQTSFFLKRAKCITNSIYSKLEKSSVLAITATIILTAESASAACPTGVGMAKGCISPEILSTSLVGYQLGEETYNFVPLPAPQLMVSSVPRSGVLEGSFDSVLSGNTAILAGAFGVPTAIAGLYAAGKSNNNSSSSSSVKAIKKSAPSSKATIMGTRRVAAAAAALKNVVTSSRSAASTPSKKVVPKWLNPPPSKASAGIATKKSSYSRQASSIGTKILRDAMKAPGGEEPNNSQFAAALGLAVITAGVFLTQIVPLALSSNKNRGAMPTLEDALAVAELQTQKSAISRASVVPAPSLAIQGGGNKAMQPLPSLPLPSQVKAEASAPAFSSRQALLEQGIPRVMSSPLSSASRLQPSDAPAGEAEKPEKSVSTLPSGGDSSSNVAVAAVAIVLALSAAAAISKQQEQPEKISPNSSKSATPTDPATVLPTAVSPPSIAASDVNDNAPSQGPSKS